MSSSRSPQETPSSTDIDTSELPTAIPEGGFLINGQTYDNFSSKEAAASYRTLNSSTTGCFAENGSMPILLAENDYCLLGFFCPNSTDAEPPQYVIRDKTMARLLTAEQVLPAYLRMPGPEGNGPRL